MENNFEAIKIAQNLRKKCINVDIEMSNKKLKKALNYANVENIPFVIIVGDNELVENKVIFKDMETGMQERGEVGEIVKYLNSKIDKKVFI